VAIFNLLYSRNDERKIIILDSDTSMKSYLVVF